MRHYFDPAYLFIDFSLGLALSIGLGILFGDLFRALVSAIRGK